MLDEIDRRIIRELQRDARQSLSEIARTVELSSPAVLQRIKKLEQEGTIQGYTVLLDPEKAGRPLVAFIRVRTMPGPGETELFETAIAHEQDVLECYDVDGEDSYIMKVRTANPQTLRALLARVRSLPGVVNTVTSIALHTVLERPGVELFQEIDK